MQDLLSKSLNLQYTVSAQREYKCSIEMYKETLPIQGKWKQVSESGVYEAYKMLGKKYLNVLFLAIKLQAKQSPILIFEWVYLIFWLSK